MGLTVAFAPPQNWVPGAASGINTWYLPISLQPWGQEDSRASPLYYKQENKTQEWSEGPRSLALHFLFSIFK